MRSVKVNRCEHGCFLNELNHFGMLVKLKVWCFLFSGRFKNKILLEKACFFKKRVLVDERRNVLTQNFEKIDAKCLISCWFYWGFFDEKWPLKNKKRPWVSVPTPLGIHDNLWSLVIIIQLSNFSVFVKKFFVFIKNFLPVWFFENLLNF